MNTRAIFSPGLTAALELLSALSRAVNNPARTILFLLTAVTLAAQPVQTAAKVNLNKAALSTREGRNAAARLQSAWAPEVAAIAKRRADLNAARERFSRENKSGLGWWPGFVAMDARPESGGIDQIGKRMQATLRQYASERGYSLTLDTSTRENPVLIGRTVLPILQTKLFGSTMRPGLPDVNRRAGASCAGSR